MRHSENTPSCTCTMEEESASFPAFLSVPPGARADKEDKPWVSSHPSPVRISSIGQRFRDSTAAVPNRSLCFFFFLFLHFGGQLTAPIIIFQSDACFTVQFCVSYTLGNNFQLR